MTTIGTTWTNWAKTVSVDPDRVLSPASVAELQCAITNAVGDGLTVKAVGAGHSFTAVAEARGLQVRLDNMRGIEHIDADARLVTVRAGTTLRELGDALWDHGLSMSNLGDIDTQTISGAISTGTHGTGSTLGGLATQVRSLDLILADGSQVSCSASERPDLFSAARVGLGALGIICSITLECEPAFTLTAAEAPDSLDSVLAQLDSLVDGNDHFEFYWFPHTRRTLTKRNNRSTTVDQLRPVGRLRGWVDDELLSNKLFEQVNRLATARPALIPRINTIAAQALSARAYSDRSYRVFATSRSVKFREMEYAVPRAAVPSVLAEIERWLWQTGDLVSFPVEVRFAAADDIWLSTAYGRETGYIAVHQYLKRDYERYFRAVEAIAKAHGGRPHWGKLHWRNAESLREDYPHFEDFRVVRDQVDPARVFGNDYLLGVLGS